MASIAFAPEFSVAVYTYGASEVQLPTALVDQIAPLPGPGWLKPGRSAMGLCNGLEPEALVGGKTHESSDSVSGLTELRELR